MIQEENKRITFKILHYNQKAEIWIKKYYVVKEDYLILGKI